MKLLLVALFAAVPLMAQQRDLFRTPQQQETRPLPYVGLGGAAYYDLSFGMGLTIPVNLWGYVRAPGATLCPARLRWCSSSPSVGDRPSTPG